MQHDWNWGGVPDDPQGTTGLESHRNEKPRAAFALIVGHVVPTVSDILREISHSFVPRAGTAGLGREVRRIVHVRAADGVAAPIGSGDLVVYASPPVEPAVRYDRDRALRSLLSTGVVGVLTDIDPNGAALQTAEELGTPLLATVGPLDAEELHGALVKSLEIGQSLVDRQRAELQREFSDLVRAGGSATVLLQRLVEISSKGVALHGPNGRVERSAQAILQSLSLSTFSRVIEASDADVQRWLMDTADAAVNNILYLEIAAENVVRLYAPLWRDGHFAGGLSLVGQSDQMSARDRVALLAAVRAMSGIIGRKSTEVPTIIQGRRCLILALRAAAVSLDELADVARRVLDGYQPNLVVRAEHVGVVLADDGCEPWQRRQRIAGWRTAISTEVGLLSIGYADYCARSTAELERAMVCAAEAALVGDHLFGAGRTTSYADAQLAKFFAGSPGQAELRTLYERVIGKLTQDDGKRERELVKTLDVYCEAMSTAGTAERLQVHRNTVLYRLKQIQELTSLDVNDGASRLLLQLGVLASRFVEEARRHVQPDELTLSLGRLLTLSSGSQPHIRTA
jgi:PucR-like helix-turn-helix protein